MATLTLHCLHGTFQGPGVWNGLAKRLARRLDVPLRVVAEDVEPPSAGGLRAWARAFCRRIREATETSLADAPRALLGYSLGGRLAMQALLTCPDSWVAAVLVAAHPGDSDPAVRAEVRSRDAAWASRCRIGEPWEQLLADWDAQPVFGGHPNLAPRLPETLDGNRCARMFEEFSRAGQADLRPALAAARLPPVLYVTGRDDPRYPTLGDELAAAVPGLRHETVEGAGHRVPWDRPEEFDERVARFLSRAAVRRGDRG